MITKRKRSRKQDNWQGIKCHLVKLSKPGTPGRKQVGKVLPHFGQNDLDKLQTSPAEGKVPRADGPQAGGAQRTGAQQQLAHARVVEREQVGHAGRQVGRQHVVLRRALAVLADHAYEHECHAKLRDRQEKLT